MNETRRDIYSVYALQDPRTEEVRYVGCTDDVRDRYVSHISGREKNAAKNEWIAELKSLDMLPILIILEDKLAKPYANARERHWMSWYSEQGARLTNSRIPLSIPMGVAPQQQFIDDDAPVNIESRLDVIERKLDRLVALLEQKQESTHSNYPAA